MSRFVRSIQNLQKQSHDQYQYQLPDLKNTNMYSLFNDYRQPNLRYTNNPYFHTDIVQNITPSYPIVPPEPKEILPNNHLDLALCLKNISGVYQKSNDLKTALVYLEEAIRIENKVTHFKHYDLACSFHNLACIHFRQNEYDKAMDLNDKSFQIRKAFSV